MPETELEMPETTKEQLLTPSRNIWNWFIFTSATCDSPHHVTCIFLLKSKLHISNKKCSFYSFSLGFLGPSSARIFFIHSYNLYFHKNRIYRNTNVKFLKDGSKLSQVLQELSNNRRRRRGRKRRRRRRKKGRGRRETSLASISISLTYNYRSVNVSPE